MRRDSHLKLTHQHNLIVVIEWFVKVVVIRIYNMGSICKIDPDGKGKSRNQWNPNDSKRNRLNRQQLI
jgi:hypothetical protein